MDLALNKEQQSFRDEIRAFADNEVGPTAAFCEPDGRFPRQLLPRLARLGLMGIAVPRNYGGRGLDTLCACLAIRELARACPSTAVAVHVNNFVYCAPLLRFGSEAQKRAHLAPSAAGLRLGGFALSEPDAGADPSRIRVVARSEERGYRLSGRKAWVTNGGISASYLVVARVERSGREEGTALFIVDAGTPGMLVGKPESTLGLRSALVTDISFDGCKVQGGRVLGDGANGLKLALEVLQASRIGVAAQSVGIARGAMESMAAGRRDTRVQDRLAGIAAGIEAANLMMLRAAWHVDRGTCSPKEASMAKLICSETAVRASAACLDASGPEALRDRHPSSRFWRDARVTTIYGGPSEIQRGVIARQLLLASG